MLGDSPTVTPELKPAFTKGNRYLFDPSAYAWNIPSGWTCPAAEQCLAKADRLDLPIDTDDRLAAFGTDSFALLENFTKPDTLTKLSRLSQSRA